ncbi:WD40 repeat-like protein [Penicillium herquei]|nr:WD40 repeat-like protein [Penicillium herquei]
MSEGMRRVIGLSSYIQGLPPTGRVQMRSFAYDVRRFLLKFRGLIEETPLELYTSALLYVPEETCIRKYFGSPNFCSISHFPTCRKQWDPLEQTLFTSPAKAYDVALSPDGKLVASSCLRKASHFTLTRAGCQGMGFGNWYPY